MFVLKVCVITFKNVHALLLRKHFFKLSIAAASLFSRSELSKCGRTDKVFHEI